MTGPFPFRGREAGGSQSRKARGNLGPRYGILHQTASRLPIANHVFLESWRVDICQEGRSQRSAPQRRHTAHPRRHSHCTPRKLSGWEGGGDKTHRPPGRGCSPSTWSPELLRPGKGTKRRPNRACAFVEYREPEPEGSDLGSACNAGPALHSFPAERPGA